MTDAELRQIVLDTLGDIPPRPTSRHSRPTRRCATSWEIDSMDFLNFVIALHEKLGVDIPEADYRSSSP